MPGDIKQKFLASAVLADSGLNSLAASSTRLSGYETVAVDVAGISGGPPTDILLSGHFKADAANHNAGYIDIWVIAAENDTPDWPDVFDGTASAETASSANVLNACGRLAASIAGDSANDRVYSFAPVSVASLFGGVLPDQFVVFVSHNIHTSTNAWASSGHEISYTPVLQQYT
jgi:hypothetical protein